MSTLKILTICGSLRAKSSNAAVLDALALVAPERFEFVRYLDLGVLPQFNPDNDAVPPPLPEALRQAVGHADALVISSPEYAHGIAGSLKNALDWLVGSLQFPGTPVGVINAAPRASHADAQLREVLRMMSASLDAGALLTLPIQGTGRNAEAIAADPAIAEALRAMLDRLEALAVQRASAES